MIDFASALYLGLRHPADQLGDYAALTTGYPASLAAAPLARRLAADAAALQGCEAGMVAPSTLHLAIDVFEQLGRTHALIADEALYPVMRWGLERVRGLGAPVAWFRHGDLADLARRIRDHRLRRRGRPPAVIADATRLAGLPLPLARYLTLVRRHGGLIVIDHSQMLGLMGAAASPRQPWGSGGGGALRHAGCDPAQPVLLVASWAKAFGAPLATLCGPAALVQAIARDGPTQTHSSAASEVALRAGLRALEINRMAGAARAARPSDATRAARQYGTHRGAAHRPARRRLPYRAAAPARGAPRAGADRPGQSSPRGYRRFAGRHDAARAALARCRAPGAVAVFDPNGGTPACLRPLMETRWSLRHGACAG